MTFTFGVPKILRYIEKMNILNNLQSEKRREKTQILKSMPFLK